MSAFASTPSLFFFLFWLIDVDTFGPTFSFSFSLLSPSISLFPFWIISGKFIPLLPFPPPLSPHSLSPRILIFFLLTLFLTLALYSAEITIYIVRNSKDEKRSQIFFSTFFSGCLDLVCVRWDWRGWNWGVDVWCGDVLFILYLYFNTLILMCFGGEGMRDDGIDGWLVCGGKWFGEIVQVKNL